MKTIKFIDLFAGLGGTRLGFEQACRELGFKPECVFTSEIKSYAVKIYQHNFNNEPVHGDITQINENQIPSFDYLLGGFPCQAFSTAGKKMGFDDTRGTLFFDIVRIIKHHNPQGFLLENVEGLVTHDKKNSKDEIGNTLSVILNQLQDLGYRVNWRVLNAKNFGIPQDRKRVYIIGHKLQMPSLDNFQIKKSIFKDIKEHNLPSVDTDFTRSLLNIYDNPQKLLGKSIKDKRGGDKNIHSWDLELKGKISNEQKELMSILLKERRKRKWAEIKGIVWMDGMPLTLDEIHSFNSHTPKDKLKTMLDDLVCKKYLRFEYPKDQIIDNGKTKRVYATHLEKGYNIVAGKLSFEFNKILDDDDIAPTIVATETDRLGVLDNMGIRRLSERECLRFFGFPEYYQSNVKSSELYDLIGNTVVVPVIKEVAKRIL